MEVCIVSRRFGSQPHWSEAAAAAAAQSLALAGCPVRWLQAGAAAPSGSTPGVEAVPVPGGIAPFRSVAGRIGGVALDVALTRALRQRPAEIVHDFGYGAPGSANTLWIAARMGARCVATVRAAEVLCHRQTLVDGWGNACREFSDPVRCTACCLLPAGAGLSPAAAALGRAMRALGGFSPFPNPLAFRNRMDILVGGLALAEAVFVHDDGEAALLAGVGLKQPVLRRAGGPDDLLAGVYRELLAG
jgi:hypothetical protein